MATGARGEATIHLSDREVSVLYTNRALAEAEGALGKSIIQVVQGFADGSSGISDIAHVLHAGMKAARRDAGPGEKGPPVTLDTAYQVLDEAGFATVAAAVMEAVAAVLSYGPGEEEEADPNA